MPTLNVTSEAKRNLADLKLATIEILETASGVESKLLFDKIDFVITDQTAHNFGVEELVAQDLGTVTTPEHLFCNVHLSLMFNRILTKQWRDIENVIGRDKIYSNFLVNATTTASCVTEHALDCITKLINHDFDQKPWNKSNESDMHIAPKHNKSVSLKYERFNHLTVKCALTLYHYEDVSSFLEKYVHVTNQLASIVRCFLDLDFLLVMYCVGALIGLHLIEPFLSLTTSSKTTYSKLIPAFQQLYEDLSKTDPVLLLDVNKYAFNFVCEDRFQDSRYDDDICEAISRVTDTYRYQVVHILKMLLPHLAEGFLKQKGKIFGFGDVESDIHSLSNMDPVKFEQAPIHNLDAERRVGFINYELGKRGAEQLMCAHYLK